MMPVSKKSFFSVCLLVMSFLSQAQTVWYVDASYTSGTGFEGSGDGTSWANPKNNLAFAIYGAQNTDTIWVKQGIILPTRTGTDRDFAFEIGNLSLTILGGFQGNETQASQRDPQAYPTILSGNINDPNDNTDNTYSVIRVTGGSNVTVDGFTIQDAYDDINYGGSIFVKGSTLRLLNCIVRNNISTQSGAAINAQDDAGVIANAEVVNTQFINNTSAFGVISWFNAQVNLDRCLFENHGATTPGPIFDMLTHTLTQTWNNNVTNSLFYNNTFAAGNMVRGVNLSGDLHLKFRHCTFNNNTFDKLWNVGDFHTLTNAIVWGNTLTSGSTDSDQTFFSIIQPTAGFTYTNNNLNADPLFTNAANPIGADNTWGTVDDGLQLKIGSPARNAADAASSTTTDFAGTARPIGGVPDIGAYESNPCLQISSNVVYVDSSATTGLNQGNSWANAFTSLADALAYAHNCASIDTIKVTKGTYLPTYKPFNGGIEVSSSDQREVTFHLRSNLVLEGGYPNGGGTRDPKLHPTKLSGDLNNDDTVTGSGQTLTFQNNTENAYHVVVSIEDSNCKLDGFTISGGNANGNFSLNVDAISIFHGDGGGIVLNNTELIVENSAIQFHEGLKRGGAVVLSAGNPLFKNCDFDRNKNIEIGGVMYAVGTVSLMENCNFYGNRAFNTGAIELVFGANMTFRNCTFSENYAEADGGAVRMSQSNPTFENNLFFNNTAQTVGGAVRLQDFANPTFKSCVIYGNTAAFFGGGINLRPRASGNFFNCIIWNNTATSTTSTAEQGINKSSSQETTTLTNCIVQNATGDPLALPNLTLVNPQNADPLFTNPANPIGADNTWGTADDGFTIQFLSPARNTADAASSTTTDFTGTARPIGGVADIGAYESNPCLQISSNVVYVDSSATTGLNQGNSWANAFTSLADALAYAHNCASIDTIKVAKGTYLPNYKPFNGGIQVPSSDPREVTFHLKSNLVLEGGYPNGGGTRDPKLHPTKLSGDLNNDDTVTGSGETLTFQNNAENAYHVIVSLDDTNCKLDGFIISGGNASKSGLLMVGTGELYHNSGAGIFLTNSQLVTTNSIIRFNSSISDGGGVSLYLENPTFTNCNFEQNKSGNSGGALMSIDNTAPFENCNFIGNSSFLNGGAIQLQSGATTTFRKCTFSGNYANTNGGAVASGQANPTFENSLFFNNGAKNNAGAILIENFGSPSYKSCVIYGNTANSFGGGVSVRTNGRGDFFNSIIWGNTITTTTDEDQQGIYKAGNGQTTTLTNCIVQNATGDPLALSNLTLVNVQNADPLFTNPANPIGADNLWGTADDGLQVQICSPAVDTALDSQASITDFAGNTRIDLAEIGTATADIGAYELQSGIRPTLSLGSNSPVCNGTAISLNSTVTNATTITYNWSGPQGFTATDANPTVVNFGADKAGKYYLTANADGCVLTDSVETNIIPIITYVPNPADSKAAAACVGDTITFGITPNFDYQTLVWQKKVEDEFIDLAVDTVFTQVNQTQLKVNGVQLAFDSTYYRVKFTTVCQEIFSDTFLINLPNVPRILTQPTGQVICRMDIAQLHIATSGPTLSHQWQIQVPGDTLFRDITSVKSDSTTLLIGSSANGSLLRCVVRNDCGSRISDTVSVIIDNTVEIFVQPLAQTVCENGTVQFNTTAFHIQGEVLDYRWQMSTDNGVTFSDLPENSTFSNVNSATLLLSNVPVNLNGNLFRCVIANYCNTTPVELTVNGSSGISLEQSPQNRAACVGTSTTFSVQASGNNLVYQWQVNTGSGFENIADGINYQGVSTATLTVQQIAAAMNSHQFRALVSNNESVCTQAGVLSAVATLTIGGNGEAATIFWNSPISDNQGISQAVDFVVAINDVTAPDGKVTYQAGKAVVLNPGFEAQSGTVFEAKIQNPCVLPGTLSEGNIPKEIIK